MAMKTKTVSILGVLAVLALIVVLVLPFLGVANDEGAQASTSKPSPTASAPSNPAECSVSWTMATSDYENTRWFPEGISEIKNAKTPEEATQAANVWLERVRKDPNLLAGAIKYFFKQDVNKATLTDTNGCASETAVDLSIQLDLALANAKSIISDPAPTNGYNSGVNDSNVIGASAPGIGGDRTAIKVVLEDGTEIWIMARCGNIATIGPPPVPHGTTDNPPTSTPTPTCPPGQQGSPCKDLPANDPYVNDNAPDGGGANADTGSGTFVPEPEMTQPPVAPRANPVTPPVVVTHTAAPSSPTPTRDPAPLPTPPAEVAPAPATPVDPAPACVSAPGTAGTADDACK